MSWTSPLWRRLGGRHARRLESLLDRGFVALDVETTHVDPSQAALVALAAIPFVGGQPEAGYDTLVDPGCPIPASSAVIHGITDTMVAGAPRVDEALAALEAALGEEILVGHHVAFDLAVLARARGRGRRPPLRNLAVDTMRLAAALHPEWRVWTLEETAARLGVTIDGRHTARGDAVAAGRILLALLPRAAAKGCHTVPELLWLQEIGAARLSQR
jgi:DNA polymerase-3 subunit epsilon